MFNSGCDQACFDHTMAMIHCLVFLLATAVQGSDVITCDASSSSVSEGEDVSITCHFPYDVSQMARIWVAMDHYPDNVLIGAHSDRMVDCMKFNSPEMTCNATAGCSIYGEVKKSLTLKIKTVSSKHDGGFMCHIMPSQGKIPGTDICSLSVGRHAEKETTNIGLIVAVVTSNILMVTAFALAVFIVISWWRNVTKRKESKSSATLSEVEKARQRLVATQ